MNSKLVLLLTQKDPWGDSTGGQTTFARHLLSTFGETLAVCSHCVDPNISKGNWIKRQFGSESIWFISLGLQNIKKYTKPFIPDRLKTYLHARSVFKKINKYDFAGVFFDCPELLFAAHPYKWPSICYRFAGLNNPVANSRYWWARSLGTVYEKLFIQCLKNTDPEIILAAADQLEIDKFHNRIQNKIDRSRFYQFPTRVDTDQFYPMDSNASRDALNLPLESCILATTGRLNWVKGWDLLLESLVYLKKELSHILLIFVGDGEDRDKIINYARRLGVNNNILITGFVNHIEVAKYMNSSDVCLVASYHEGWSLAMCEMLACGKTIVSTDVSGARDMINEGYNGYIVDNRNPEYYAKQVLSAAKLKNACYYSVRMANNYSLRNLKSDLKEIWSPLKLALNYENINDS